MKRIAIFLFLILILSSIPITGTSIRVNKSHKIVDIKNNHYSFDMLCYKSNSRPINISSMAEINNLNIKQEEKNSTTIDKVLSTSLSTGLMDSCWPMKCQNLHHTGRSPHSTTDNPGGEIWRLQIDGPMESGAVIDNDGVLYFGSIDYYVYALNPDGSLKWKYKTGGFVWSTPAIAEDGTIYVGSFSDHLYAINFDGTLKWKYDSGSSIYSSPNIGSDGVIYFGNMGWPDGDGCKIFALYPDGTLKWEYETGYKIASDPAIADDGTIYIGSGDGYLYAMNPDGTLKWRFKTGDEIHSHPSIADDGTIYISSNDDFLYAINPDGSLKWKFNNDWGSYSSASIGVDGTVYVTNGHLFALNPSDGSVKWSFNIHGGGHSSPAIGSDGTIYLGDGGNIIAVNPDGSERWRKKIANNIVDSSPCIGSNGEVYIGSSCEAEYIGVYGYLHCFAPQEDNHPPNTPVLSGKIKRGINQKIYVSINCNDPDDNPMSFYVDWGDGTYSDWQYDLPYMITGTHIYRRVEHVYKSTGIYNIKVKVCDDFGGESDWGTFKITISKNKNNTRALIYSVIQNHPLFNIINSFLLLTIKI